jgi:hypothetical protein
VWLYLENLKGLHECEEIPPGLLQLISGHPGLELLEIIMIRINQAFAAEFAQLDDGKGRLADFGTYSQSLTFNQNPNSETKIVGAGPRDRLKADGEFGLITIPNATKIRVLSERDPRTGRVIRGNPTGEAGDGIRRVPRSGRIRGVMSRGIGDVVTFATGYDPYGDPSFVNFGITGSYVASVMPNPGTTDEEILRELESLLDSNGIPTTFDPVQVALSFDIPLLDGQTVVWGTDDPGLDFGAAFEAIGPGSVAAPASGVLIAAGLLAIAAALALRDRPSRASIVRLGLPTASAIGAANGRGITPRDAR